MITLIANHNPLLGLSHEAGFL